MKTTYIAEEIGALCVPCLKYHRNSTTRKIRRTKCEIRKPCYFCGGFRMGWEYEYWRKA